MPKRTDLQSILILGSAPIVIGQAAGFGQHPSPVVRRWKPVRETGGGAGAPVGR